MDLYAKFMWVGKWRKKLKSLKIEFQVCIFTFTTCVLFLLCVVVFVVCCCFCCVLLFLLCVVVFVVCCWFTSEGFKACLDSFWW